MKKFFRSPLFFSKDHIRQPDDCYIRNNPSDDVLQELKKTLDLKTEKRRALGKDEDNPKEPTPLSGMVSDSGAATEKA